MRAILTIAVLLIGCADAIDGAGEFAGSIQCGGLKSRDTPIEPPPGECWRVVAKGDLELAREGDCPRGASCLVAMPGAPVYSWVTWEAPRETLVLARDLLPDGTCPLTCDDE